jgi:hypothetical protein
MLRIIGFNSSYDSGIVLPILLLFWIPMTILVVLSFYYYIRWDYLGITDGINLYYTTKFKSSLDSYLWIASQMGSIGMSFFILLSIGYLWLTKTIIGSVLYYCR